MLTLPVYRGSKFKYNNFSVISSTMQTKTRAGKEKFSHSKRLETYSPLGKVTEVKIAITFQ